VQEVAVSDADVRKFKKEIEKLEKKKKNPDAMDEEVPITDEEPP
jgi:hypothetical protein